MNTGGMNALRDGVFISNRTLVPVIRDTLVARLIGELTWGTRDSEERFKGLLVKVALRVFCRVVGHHAGWEGVTSRSDEYTGKLGKEEIRVGGDRIVEARLTKWEKGGVLLRSGLY